jgi:long-chain acyl-CoA synthetase
MQNKLFEQLANTNKNLIAISNESIKISYAELISQVTKLANELKAKNITQLGLFADNGPEWIIADLACHLAGITIIPLPLFFSEQQLAHTIKSCGNISALLTDRSEAAALLFEIETKSQLNATKLMLIENNNSGSSQIPEQTQKITFTSGSSGTPKGVCLSIEQQLNVAHSISAAIAINNVRHLCLLPLTTLLENVAGVYGPLLRGGEIIAPSLADMGIEGSTVKDPIKLLSTISKTQPSTLILVPELLMLLVTAIDRGWKAPCSLKFIAVGGAKVSKELIIKAREQHLPVFEGYGLSECGSVVSLNLPANDLIGSCGLPLAHVTTEIINGEVIVKGNSYLGYINEPNSWNQEVIHTGDQGCIDDKGFLHIQGRIKNILISSFGRNINPEWIESELLANPLLSQAIVIGDERPFCSALIATRSSDTSFKEIFDWINTVNIRLPDYARIKNWYDLTTPLQNIPFQNNDGLLTENGKPKREAINSHFSHIINSLYDFKNDHGIKHEVSSL